MRVSRALEENTKGQNYKMTRDHSSWRLCKYLLRELLEKFDPFTRIRFRNTYVSRDIISKPQNILYFYLRYEKTKNMCEINDKSKLKHFEVDLKSPFAYTIFKVHETDIPSGGDKSCSWVSEPWWFHRTHRLPCVDVSCLVEREVFVMTTWFEVLLLNICTSLFIYYNVLSKYYKP